MAWADEYDIELYPQGTSCADANAFCLTVTNTQYSFTPANGVTDYTFRVRGVNTKCGIQNGTWAQSTFDLQASITGTFYIDNGATVVGGRCTSSGATPTSPGTGASIGAENGLGSFGGNIDGTTYSITMPYVAGGTATVTLVPGTNGSDSYECACPGGCASSVSVPNENVNFYLTLSVYSNEGWWQAQGGSVYAGNTSGVAILSKIPYNTCTDAPCIAAILTEDWLATTGSAGIGVTGGGNIDSTKDFGINQGYISQRTPQAFAIGTTTTKYKENYEFFHREYSLGLGTPSDDFSGSANDAVKPTSAPSGGKAAYFHQGDLTIRQRWTVSSSESIVVFVNGNLTIDDPSNNLDDLITVEPGGFLAFIVSGNITVRPDVGSNDLNNTTPNLEGVYIANGTITIESRGAAAGGDDRFVGAGTFVGYSGVDLNRDYSDGGTRAAENNDKPVEMFMFRPDFVRNLPVRMARPRYIWQETN